MSPSRFDFQALYAALDEERRSRGLSWRQVAREIGPRISASTLTRTVRGGPMEADGVWAMIRWLGRTFETFALGAGPLSTAPITADAAGMSRFDAKSVYAALDEQRRSRGMNWQQVASEVGGVGGRRVTPAMLTRLAQGGRMGVDNVVAIAAWLGRTAESFTRPTEW